MRLSNYSLRRLRSGGLVVLCLLSATHLCVLGRVFYWSSEHSYVCWEGFELLMHQGPHARGFGFRDGVPTLRNAVKIPTLLPAVSLGGSLVLLIRATSRELARRGQHTYSWPEAKRDLRRMLAWLVSAVARREPVWRWGGSVLCVLLIAATAASFWVGSAIRIEIPGERGMSLQMQVQNGMVELIYLTENSATATWRFSFWLIRPHDLNIQILVPALQPRIFPVVARRYDGSRFEVLFPMWLAAIIVAVLCTILWRRRYRRVFPGACSNCGYDLTGNLSGICPECGTPVGKDVGSDAGRS